jgi:hypothetical protein
LSTGDFELNNTIVLYPNPVNDLLHIRNNDICSVEIYDVKLAKLYQGNTNCINMSCFSKGVYIIKINLNDGFFVIKQIVKN